MIYYYLISLYAHAHLLLIEQLNFVTYEQQSFVADLNLKSCTQYILKTSNIL